MQLLLITHSVPQDNKDTRRIMVHQMQKKKGNTILEGDPRIEETPPEEVEWSSR